MGACSMKLQKSQFNFLHYEIKTLEINVLQKTKKVLNYKTEMGLSKINYQNEFAHFAMKLEIQGETEEKVAREIILEMIGVFEGFNIMGKEKFEEYCRIIGVPNMLQAARSVIASVTSVMNMYPPVQLNLYNLQESVKAQQAMSENKGKTE